MPMDNVTLENTQQSISSRDTKSVASVMVNGKWVNLSDTLEQANVKSDVGTVAKQVAAQQEVVSNAASTADSAVAYANDAVEKSRVNSQAIVDINSAVSDAVSGAAVARSDGLRAWNAAQSNADLIDSNYASASAAISSARTEAIAAADDAKKSASAAQADIVAVRSDVAVVQADVTSTKSGVAVAKSDIADTKASLTIQAKSLSSYAAQASAEYESTASALSDAKTVFDSGVAEAKNLASKAQTTADSAVESASENAKALTSQANALSDAKKAMDSDVASAKGLANAAQSTADTAIKSASSVANDLAAVASQAKSNANGITKVTSDVGLLQTTVADNSGNISKIQETAAQIQQAVSDNAGNITTAKQTADSAVTVASDAKSNATVAVQTASGASVTAKNAQGDATTAMTTANSAITKASDAKSNATIAVQTASEASVTATNAQGDASIAKQTASDASVQIKNAQGDISALQTRAGKIEASVATNSGAIANIQVTANELKASVSDNSGNITTAKQTADSAVAVASDAHSNATVAIQTASQASITAQNASGQAASAVITANGALTTASNAKSDATVAVQTASGASLTATNAQSDATIAKQTASEATVQASNAESDFTQISIRANKIEANVATNSGAIASVQQTANGLTTTVADIKANGGGVNLLTGTSGNLQTKQFTNSWNSGPQATNGNYQIKLVKGQTYTYRVWLDNTNGPDSVFVNVRYTPIGGTDYNLGTGTPINQGGTGYSTLSFTPSADGYASLTPVAYGSPETFLAKWKEEMLEEGSVAHTWSPSPSDLQNQFAQIKQSIDGVTTTINDPKTGLNATYQTAAGNSNTISNVKGDVSQLKISASSASAALSDAAGNISSLQATAKSYSAALSDTNSNVASVTATASDLETKYADAAGDISKIKTDAKGMTQTISDAQGDIAKLKTRADGFDTQFADTNGNINKLQTDATGTTQTLANTKSDVAVLQSRADGLDAKYADAAGDINTLKANASGFSQTLVSAKGDISTLQATATGLKNTLTDAQGNISTLQSDVAGLKKTTSDHAGNIATLQADAKTLTSQMADAQGNISTLKQTASGFSSKVSGMETSLADANSKINGITNNGGGRNLIANTGTDIVVDATSNDASNWAFAMLGFTEQPKQGDLITVSAQGTLTGTGTLDEYQAILYDANTTKSRSQAQFLKAGKRDGVTLSLDNLDGNGDTFLLIYAGKASETKGKKNVVHHLMVEKGAIAHDWAPAPEDTDAKITANTTAIEQNRKAIMLKADQTTVDKTNGTVQQLQSQLKVQADQIATKVSSSDLDAKGYATQTYTQTQVKQTADAWNANLTSVKSGLTQSYTNLHATVDGIQAQVYNKDGSSKITQLSNLIATKVSQGDYNSQITQLKNDINLRVAKGDVISQINQDAGGNTLIQVANGKGTLSLNADTVVFTGAAFIPAAAITDLTADQIQAGTLSGSKVHAGDNSGNAIDMGAISPNYVGFHACANNGDNTFIDLNGIHNYGASYDTRIQQGKITTDYLTVSGGGMIDFRSGDAGVTMDNRDIKFYNSGDVNGGISFAGSNPIADRNSGGGNELRLRYDGSFALTPISDESTRLVASTKSMGLGYNQAGSTTPDKNLTGLWVNNSDRYVRLGVWNSNSAWSRAEFSSDGVNINYSGLSIGLNNNLIHMYMDGNYSATAIQLKVDGWAWINGWVEAAGHSQHSALSTKTDIQSVDDDKMLKMVNDTDLTTFLYKTDVANGETHRHIGPIIDDVHDVAQYQTPQDFIAPNGVSRDDDNMIGALFGAVKALTKRIKTLESKVG